MRILRISLKKQEKLFQYIGTTSPAKVYNYALIQAFAQ